MREWLRKVSRLGLSDDENQILDQLQKHGTQSMKVVGRGTLIRDAKDVTSSERYKNLLKNADKIISK